MDIHTRTYDNGNYGDYGRGYILKDTVGNYARTQTWWELNLLLQQAIPVRKENFGVLLRLRTLQINGRTVRLCFL